MIVDDVAAIHAAMDNLHKKPLPQEWYDQRGVLAPGNVVVAVVTGVEGDWAYCWMLCGDQNGGGVPIKVLTRLGDSAPPKALMQFGKGSNISIDIEEPTL